MESRIKSAGRDQKVRESKSSPEPQLLNLGTAINWSLDTKDPVSEFGLGWLVVDCDGNVVQINQVCLDVLGLSPGKSDSIHISDYLAPEFLDVVNDRRARRLAGKEVSNDYECRLVHPDGRELWVRLLLSVVEVNGELVGTKVIIVNNTDQKSTELKESYQRDLALKTAETQKAMIKALPADIFLLDAKGEILSLSESWEKFELDAGLAPDLSFTVGQNFLEQLAAVKDRGRKSAKIISDGLRQVLNLELPFFEHDGEYDTSVGVRWFHFAAAPLVPGKPMGAVTLHRDITDQHHQQEAHKLAQAHINELVNSVGGILWEADAKTFHFTYVSDAAERILGYPVILWTRDPDFWADHIHIKDRKAAIDYCVNATRRGENHSFRYRMIAKDGRTVWIEDQVTVIMKDGKPHVLRGVMLDITAQVEQTEAFTNLSKSIDLSLSEIYIFDAETLHFVYVNKGALQNLGFTSQQILNMTPIDLKPDFDDNIFLALLKPLSSGKIKQQTFTTRHLRADGSTYSVEVHLYPTTHQSRPSYLAVALDITERRKSEDFHQLLLQNVKNGLLLVDHNGEITLANSFVSSMFGYADQELVGETIECLVPERLRTEHVAQRREHIKNPIPFHMGTRKGLLGQRKDGSEFPVDIELSPTKIAESSYLLVVINDLTERLEIEKVAEQTRENYERVVEHMHDALVVDDLQGRVVYCNSQFLKYFGMTRLDIVDLAMDDYIAPEYLPKVKERHERRIVGEQVPDIQEFEGVRKDGSRLWLQARTTLVLKDEEIVGTQSIFLDISESRATETELRRSQTHVQELINFTPGIVWESVPGTTQFSFVSQQAERLLGYPIERWINEPNFWRDHVHSSDLKKVVREYRSNSLHDESHRIEYRMIAADGSIVWLDDRITVIYEAGQPVLLRGIMVDISERKNLMEALRNLSQREGAQVENERRRIAQELHDDYSQRMAFVALSLQALGQELPAGLDEHQAKIKELWSETKLLSTDIHNLAYELAPISLRKLGLQGAISNLCDKFFKLHSLPVDFITYDLPRRLSDNKAIALYRIVQEALNNVHKHSNAEDAMVRLAGVDGNLELTISDSGDGFDVDKGDFSHNLGLMGMAERAYMVGGTWSINSQANIGTEIKVTVPLPVPANSPSDEISQIGSIENVPE